MCGRTACTLAPDDVCQACNYRDRKGKAQKPMWRDPPGGQQYYPSYNVSPGSHTPVLLSSKHYLGELEGLSDRVIQPMMWGLVPSWHKGDPKKVSYETNNCRAEGMLEKRTYKVPLEKGRRCVVLADGFFEWKRDKDKKQPYFIYFPKSSSCTASNANGGIKKEGKMEDSDWPGIKKEVKMEDSDWPGIKKEVKMEDSDWPGIKKEVKMEDSDWPGIKKELTHEKTKNVSKECLDWDKVVDNKTSQDNEDVTQNSELKTEMKMEPSFDFPQSVKLESDLFSDIPHYGNGDDLDKKCDNFTNQQGNDNTGDNVLSSKRLLTMAGVFDIWSPPDGAPPLYTYSVITVASSAAMEWLHHRMPAILTSEEEINDWLDFGDVPLLKAVKNIRPVECIQLHPVSSVVNNSRNKTPDCVEPIDLTKPKQSASSNLMMNWLAKPKKEGVSPVKLSESPPKKKKKTESNVMMNWLNKAKKL